MADCVSCGREIEPGRLFCDQCFTKMKGRRGPLREVAEDGTGKPDAGRATGITEEKAAPLTGGAARRASGSLTPADKKKVVSLRPDLEKNLKEKYGKSRKKFTITITFSERTYQMLSRFSRKKSAGPEGGEDVAGRGGQAPAPRWRRPAQRRKGPHGRPALKAVGGRKGVAQEGRTETMGIKGWIAYRERKWDRGDYAALALAVTAGILIIVLAFLGWVRVSWGAAEGTVYGAVSIRGVDLGALTHLIIALDLAALLYILVALRFGPRLRRLDFGVVLLLAGILIIALFYANIASNQRMLDIAYRLADQRGLVPEGEQIQRQAMATAYLMALLGMLMAFSGLVRLSERREKKESGEGVA